MTLAGQLVRFAVQMLATAILARLIAPTDFGLFTMVMAIVGIATVLGDFGLSMAAIQSQNITEAQRSNLFWTNAAIGIALTILIFFLAPAIAALYSTPELVAITQLMSFTFLLNSLTAQFRAEVSSKLRFKSLAVVDIVAVVGALIAAILLALAGLGYWALVAQQIAIAALTLTGLIISARWLPGLPRRGVQMRSLYTFGANTLGVQLFSYLTSNIDSILIGRTWGAASLGLYDRAYQLFRLPMQQIAAPMTKVALPVLSKLQADERYERYVQRAQLVLGYGFGGAFFMLAALSDPAIDILLGEGWESAKPIFATLAIGGVFQGMGFVYYWVFLSRAMTGLQLRWTLIGRSAMICAIAIGVLWGPLGAAAGAAIGQALNWALQTIFPMSKTGIRRSTLLRIAVRPIIIFAPLVLGCLALSYLIWTDLAPWLEALGLAAVIATYLVAASIIPAVRRDYRELWDVVRRLRR